MGLMATDLDCHLSCLKLSQRVVVPIPNFFTNVLLGGGDDSWLTSPNLVSTANYNPSLISGSPQHLPPENQSTNEGFYSVAGLDYVMEIGRYPIDPVIKLNHSCKTTLNNLQNHKLPNSLSLDKSCNSIKGEMLVVGSSDSMGNEAETASPEQHFPEAASGDPVSGSVLDELPETCIEHPTDDSVICNSNCSLKLEDSFSNPSQEASEQQNGQLAPQSSIDCSSSFDKSGGSAKVSNSCDLVESRKTSMCRGSTGSDVSEDSSTSSFCSAISKPHKGNDTRWEAIQAIQSQDGMLGLNHFRLLRKLGSGDIGSVYLCELSGTKSYFAMKVMDKTALASRKKLVRAQTEREILQSLDHPFLPTLYTHFETEKFSCLVMEFCPGGDLHALRQRQPGKLFTEQAARFYVAEVLLAMEYLHMLGIIYRDLKPENVLVRDDGHIMLSDFDLSLTCAVCPTLVRSSNTKTGLSKKNSGYCVQPDSIESTCVITPACIQPTCFMPSFLSRKSKKEKKNKPKNEANNQVPELLAEPTSARSMSFVGTHEYLAPEIVKGEGHGSAVDWWTFGIFLYELLFGKTPFKGSGNRATLLNVVGQPLRFPESPSISFAARDLIRGLLVKEPKNRLAHRRGATEIKQHPFFQNVNWALIRCTNPPQVPKPFKVDLPPMKEMPKAPKQDNNVPVPVPAPAPAPAPVVDVKPSGNNYLEIDFF